MTRKSKERRWDSAGWGVFFVLFAVAALPLLYLSHGLRTPGVPPLAPYFGAILGAVLAAGIVTATLNSILQSRAARGGGEESDGDA